MIITIPDEQAVSWNKFYSQGHWMHRKKEADRVHLLVRVHLDTEQPMFSGLVDIHVKCYYPTNKRPDSDNVCAKLYIDGLISWVIEDDNHKFVRTVSTTSLLDRGNPRLEIHITEI